jgi:hypothetical protein
VRVGKELQREDPGAVDGYAAQLGAEDFDRRRPPAFLSLAAGAGLAASRLLVSSSPRSSVSEARATCGPSCASSNHMRANGKGHGPSVLRNSARPHQLGSPCSDRDEHFDSPTRRRSVCACRGWHRGVIETDMVAGPRGISAQDRSHISVPLGLHGLRREPTLARTAAVWIAVIAIVDLGSTPVVPLGRTMKIGFRSLLSHLACVRPSLQR